MWANPVFHAVWRLSLRLLMTGIVGSNSAEDMDIRLLCLLSAL